MWATLHSARARKPLSLNRPISAGALPKLNEQRNTHTVARSKSESLLIGRIYDDRGNRMTPSHARKGGIKYRYYLSSPLLHGQPGRVGSVRRMPAAEVEALVACAVREHLGDPTESEDRDLIRNHVVRVEVQADELAVELKAEIFFSSRRRHTKFDCDWSSDVCSSD